MLQSQMETADPSKQQVLELLNDLAQSGEKSVTVSSTDDAYLQVHNLLKLFDLVNISAKGENVELTPKSEIAARFIQSLARYIENDLSLISNWEHVNPNDEVSDDVLVWGSKLLHKLEEKRAYAYSDKHPLDEVNIMLLVIKAKINGEDQPRYLFQFNERTMMYQLVGGYKEYADEVKAVTGQLEWKLPKNEWKHGETFTFSRITEPVINYGVSRQRGVYTKYSTEYFLVECEFANIKLSEKDAWIALDEITSEVTEEGIPLMGLRFPGPDSNLDQSLVEELSEAGLSLKQPQAATKRLGAGAKRDVMQDRLEQLVKAGESDSLEFKSTLRWDLHQNIVNKALEKVIMKSVSAFMNAQGGVLLVGVADDGEILGLDKDISTVKRQNEDGLLKHVYDLLSNYLGAENIPFVHTDILRKDGKPVLIFEVRKAAGPVFLKEGENREFYARAGNTSKKLNAEQVYKYISANW